MRSGNQTAVIADHDVDVQPWFDMPKRTTPAHVTLQTPDGCFVEKEPLSSIAAHLGTKSFE